ncbi:DUF4190 domain-containing protein [Nocardioides sp.]|uniref:DUF4190 domain-containing protein n=1 Tax=Nocardioides sp. TaxID=35761 RepID=UPI003D11D281
MSYQEPPPPGGGYPPPPPGGNYPPPPPPGGGYGQQPYGGMPGQPPRNSPLAIVSLVLGIVAIIPCFYSCFVFAIAASVTGFIAKGQIDSSSGALRGRGMAQAGFILGLVAIALGIVWWILTLTTDAFDFEYNYSS